MNKNKTNPLSLWERAKVMLGTIACLDFHPLPHRQCGDPNIDWQFGIPLDQALVYSGGESTNLRDYDPATTYSAGDKLVFSGLVSLDPRLNLTPDLAETWDVTADGTVYTFTIRQNAKFHDGRQVTAQDVVYSWERAASPGLSLIRCSRTSEISSAYAKNTTGRHIHQRVESPR
jgi:ABC-type transport system substrate-binding protein